MNKNFENVKNRNHLLLIRPRRLYIYIHDIRTNTIQLWWLPAFDKTRKNYVDSAPIFTTYLLLLCSANTINFRSMFTSRRFRSRTQCSDVLRWRVRIAGQWWYWHQTVDATFSVDDPSLPRRVSSRSRSSCATVGSSRAKPKTIETYLLYRLLQNNIELKFPRLAHKFFTR